MPPKIKKRYTQKDKKRTGRKQKNTTFKKGGASKTLAEIIKDKLEANDYKLIQQLIDNPDRKYAILIDFCKNNKLVVNTEAFLSHSYRPPDEGYENYNHSLTIPKDFEKGKLLEIIIYANKDGIQYNTVVNDNKYQAQNCKPEKLPVIYRVPEVTTPSDIMSSSELSSEMIEPLPEEEKLQGILRDPIPYFKDLTSPSDVIAPAEDMSTLQNDDVEDVTDDIIKQSVSKPSDGNKELEETIKKEEPKGVSEKPELKYFDDWDILEKKTKDKSTLRSLEEGDVARELAKEKKKEKEAKKEEKEKDRLEHEARLKAEEERKRQEEENIDDDEEMLVKQVSDDEEEKERQELFQKYTDEIHNISDILQSMMLTSKTDTDKTHRDDYTPSLGHLKTKYEALIGIFDKDKTQTIPKETKEKIINVLTNNHRRLQALRTSDRGMFKRLQFEGNFMKKVQDSLSIMNTLNTYFHTLDESLMKNFGNNFGINSQVSYDYTKKVDGGKKTRKNRRKTKRRKTKKRI